MEIGALGYMQTAYGCDFSRVKVHTDAKARALAEKFNARAFTIGDHIVFGPGEYRPDRTSGALLIAHELAHVIQQRGGDTAKARHQGEATQMLEADADRAAVRALLPVTGVFRRFSGVLQKVAGRVRPALKSGLTLQRCSKTPSATTAVVKDPIQMRKVISGPLEGGKKVSDHFPDIVGTNSWGSDTTAGPFDNGVRAGSVVQLIGEIPAGVSHSEYTLTQTITVSRLRIDGTADALEGTTLDDIARSGRDQSTAPFRQVWGNNVSMCDPISGVPYNTLTSYDFAANATSGIQHSSGSSKTVAWSVQVQAAGGTVTKNTVT
jgi:hypothetical protein